MTGPVVVGAAVLAALLFAVFMLARLPDRGTEPAKPVGLPRESEMVLVGRAWVHRDCLADLPSGRAPLLCCRDLWGTDSAGSSKPWWPPADFRPAPSPSTGELLRDIAALNGDVDRLEGDRRRLLEERERLLGATAPSEDELGRIVKRLREPE